MRSAGRRPARRPGAALLSAAAVVAALGVGAPAAAQPPDARWRTVETAHYRVHYPAPAEAWARATAARLESVRERVAAEVGYAPPGTVEVVVADPLAAANGLAVPRLGGPALVLWTTSPAPASLLGQYRDWPEVLAIHEQTHLAHLLRPSRNPLLRGAGRVVPVGPIARGAPRWVTEGYATLIEGRLTGSGRPFSELRAAVLRTRARAGRLPGYRALADDRGSWLGRSMAYLAGSAYLEWLERRAGPGALGDLWARMTARRRRGFDDAFRGVFGRPPEELYARFTAELTAGALAAEEALAPAAREGEPFQRLDWAAGAPAVSPGGDRLAVVLDHRDRPPELVVWATGPDPEAERRWREERERLAARDPEDVPAVRVDPLPREPLAVLPTLDGLPPSEPRWLPGGAALLVVRPVPDAAGVLHPDLFRWTPPPAARGGATADGLALEETDLEAGSGSPAPAARSARSGGSGRLERLTRGADLRSPDPAPDGRWAVAVRQRWGVSELVRVDLGSGAVEPLVPPSVDGVYAQPRIAPDGRALAYLRHAGGRWRLMVAAIAPDPGSRDATRPPEPGAPEPEIAAGGLAGNRPADPHAVPRGAPALGPPRELPVGGAGLVASPAWGAGGRLYAVLGEAGFLDVFVYDRPLDPAAGPARRITRVQGAALAPEPVPVAAAGGAPGDGALFYLSLEAGGPDLYRLEPAVPAPPAPEWERRLAERRGAWVPALPPVASTPSAPSPAGAAAEPPVDRAAAPEPAAELPPGEPYGIGPQRLTPLAGVRLAPSARSVEAGLAGGDPVGRTSYLAVAAAGDEIEGAAAAAAWRGWPVEVGVHLLALRETPSAQPDEATGLGRRLDLDRRGAELAAGWGRRTPRSRFELAGAAYAGTVEPAGGGGGDPDGEGGRRDQRSLLVEATDRGRGSRGRWAVDWRLSAAGALGETGSDGWRRATAAVELGVARDDDRLAAGWWRGSLSGTPDPVDRFRLGGVPSTLLPLSLAAVRVAVPALPAGSRLGEEAESQRLSLELEALAGRLFFERHRVWSGDAGAGDDGGTGAGRNGWVRLAGVEWRRQIGPIPLVPLPRLEVTAGAARVLDPPLEGDHRGWISVSWRP